MAKKKHALTARERKFYREYLIDLNATQAAKRTGYSAKYVNKIGPRKLMKVGIQQEIARLQTIEAERAEVTPEKVIGELKSIAFSEATAQTGSIRYALQAFRLIRA